MTACGRSDDPSIPDAEELYLRVPPDQLTADKNRGGFRASSVAFDQEELSVYLSSVLSTLELDVRAVLHGHPDTWSVAAITAASVRQYNQIVVRDPVEPATAPYDPAHALVIGPKPSKPRSKMAKHNTLAIVGDTSQAS